MNVSGRVNLLARGRQARTDFKTNHPEIQTTTALKSQYLADPVGFGKALRDCVYDLCWMKMQTNAFDARKANGKKKLNDADLLLSADDVIDYEESTTDKLLVALRNFLMNRDQ